MVIVSYHRSAASSGYPDSLFYLLAASIRYGTVEQQLHHHQQIKMYLMKTEDGKYTLKKETSDGTPTRSAHPCRFSPDDKFSRHRVTIKKRFGLLKAKEDRK